MSRRTGFVLLVLTALLVASPSLAHDFHGSTEEQQVERSCGAAADPHYSQPTATDCRDANGAFDPAMTYTATYYSNNVSCGSTHQLTPEPANATGVRVYGSAATSGVSAGTCSDGTGSAPSVIQGRVTYTGSLEQGSRLAVDGDKDNSNATTQGWITITKAAGASVPTYACGDEHSQGGRADSDHPTERDTSGECGS